MHRTMLSVKGKGYSRIYSENPFHEDPQPKAFYYPTQEKALSKEEKQLSLSPKRAADSRRPQDEEQLAEKKFLSGSHAIRPMTSVQTHLPKSPDSSNFDESWPDSERPSSPSMDNQNSHHSLPYASVRKHVQPTFTSHPVGLDWPSTHTGDSQDSASRSTVEPGLRMPEISRERFTGAERRPLHLEREDGRKGKVVEPGGKEGVAGKGSVLQRYIERFRHGVPMSREERARLEGKQTDDFWWLESGLATPNSTSTPKEEEGRSLSLTCQGKRTLTVENLRKQDDLDKATRQLQEKTERVLHSAGSMASSGPVVSTEGLGSTGSDVTGSSFSETAVRPMFLPREGGLAYPRADRQLGKGAGGGIASPQGDILYKWRLQRKLEAARQGSYVPADKAQDRPPKTSAEKEVERRLASFRDSLLERGSVVKAHLLQARVEKDIKQVQSMMDTAVQTSPAKSPPSSSSSLHGPVQPPPWSGESKTSTAAQAWKTVSDSSPFACDAGDGAPPQPQAHTKDFASSDNRGAFPSSSKGKQDDDSSCPGKDVQYRQFLEAERPQDGEGAGTTSPSTHTPRQDSSSPVDINNRQVARPGSSKPSAKQNTAHQRSQRSGVMPPPRSRSSSNDKIVYPHDGGDGSFMLEHFEDSHGKKHRVDKLKLADGVDRSEMADRHGDSDSSSAQSDSQRRGSRKERKTAADKQTPKQHHSKTKAGGEPSSARQNVANLNNNNNRDGECFSSSQDDRRAREDSEGQRTSLAHRRPPTDAGVQSRSGVERSLRSGVMPPPQSSSSPARTSLSSAIGQVVQDRLFDMSVSVLSSVDSVSSLQHSAVSPLPPSRHVTSTAESDVESDGEFESDPLLAVLRQQRQRHEAQLRCLDSILAERDVS